MIRTLSKAARILVGIAVRAPRRTLAAHAVFATFLVTWSISSIESRLPSYDSRDIELALYDNSLERVWDPEHTGLSHWKGFRTRFGADEFILVTVEAKSPLDGDSLQQLDRYATALRAGTPAYHVLWAGDLPYAPESLTFGDTPTQEEVAEFVGETAVDPHAHRLIAATTPGFRAAMLVGLPAPILDDAARQQMRADLHDRWRASEPPAAWSMEGMGMPVLLGELRRAIIDSMRINLPLANAICIALLAVVVRRPRLVAASAGAIAWAEGLSLLGFLGTGRAFNYVSCYMAVCVVVVALASTLHVMTHYARERETTAPGPAARTAVASVATPLFVSQLTTALALGSLAWADHVAIADFGRFSAAGLLLVAVTSVSWLPAVLTLVDTRSPTPSPSLPPALHPKRWAAWSYQHPRSVIGAWLAAAGFAAAGLPHLEFGSTLEESFVAESSTGRAIRQVSDAYGAISPIDLELSWSEPPADAASLFRRVRRVEDAIVANTEGLEDSDIWSVADVARSWCQDRQICDAPLPDGAVADALLEELLDADPADGPRWIADDSSGVHARLTAFFDLPDSVQTRRLALGMQRAATDADAQVSATITGMTTLLSELEATVVDALGNAFLRGALCIVVVLAWMLRRTRDVLLAIVANAAPIGVVVGMAGWVAAATGLHVNSTALMYLSVVVGIVVDDTTFYLVGRQEALNRGLRGHHVVADLMDRHGPAIALTSLGLAACFAALAWTDFVNARLMGGLTAATIVVAFAADVTLLPAIDRLFAREDQADAVQTNG